MGLHPLNNVEPAAALLAGEHRSAGGVEWLEGVVQRLVAAAGLGAIVKANVTPHRDEWNLEVRVGDRPFVLIKVAVGREPIDDEVIDRVEVKAMECWRSVTRESWVGEPRPWLAFVIVVDADPEARTDATATRLARLVAGRTLDAACHVVVDQSNQAVNSPDAVRSLGAFQAALLGRFVFLSSVLSAS